MSTHIEPTDVPSKLARPPMVEAILDIECDMRPDFMIDDVEYYEAFAGDLSYPKHRARLFQQVTHSVNDAAATSVARGVEALRFMHEDEKQVVQVRRQGFSFNRLAPYSSLDSYLSEIERCWRIYVSIVRPIRTRNLRLRYINRILLPMADHKIDLDQYLKVGPRLTDEDTLLFESFMSRNVAFEVSTSHKVVLSQASQPVENGQLPLILDIEVSHPIQVEPDDWASLLSCIGSLRNLKNQTFRKSLEDKCLNLFR